MVVFWVVAPCSALIALMMEAARTSETLINFYQTTRRYNPEDSHLRTHRRENLKSYCIRNAHFDKITFITDAKYVPLQCCASYCSRSVTQPSWFLLDFQSNTSCIDRKQAPCANETYLWTHLQGWIAHYCYQLYCCGGVRRCLWNWSSNGPFVYPPNEISLICHQLTIWPNAKMDNTDKMSQLFSKWNCIPYRQG
jgi:hypothetical protein